MARKSGPMVETIRQCFQLPGSSLVKVPTPSWCSAGCWLGTEKLDHHVLGGLVAPKISCERTRRSELVGLASWSSIPYVELRGGSSLFLRTVRDSSATTKRAGRQGDVIWAKDRRGMETFSVEEIAVLLEKSAKTNVQDLKENLACTWTDKLGCFLDYFTLMPDSEIKDFYREDEICFFLKKKKKCEKDNNCEWFGSEEEDSNSTSGECVRRISQQELDDCAETREPKKGSLCGVFQIQNACGRAKNKKKCQKAAKAGCEWEKAGEICVPSPERVATMEFLNDKKAAKVVLRSQVQCLEYSTREECEDTMLNS